MPTRLHAIVIDCDDHVAQARWWADALGWRLVADADGHVDEHTDAAQTVVEPPDDAGTQPVLLFARSRGRTPGKNRIHLDLSSTSFAGQRATVDRLLAAGARRCDVGQADVDWVVLADPEGNEFCVLAPDDRSDRPTSLAAVVVDAVDPPSLARFWSAAIGWRIAASSHLLASVEHPAGTPPALDIIAVEDPTQRKNQVHLDLESPPGVDQRTEADRLVRLGAVEVDIGQRDVPWVVLADPEGHEFCVHAPRLTSGGSSVVSVR